MLIFWKWFFTKVITKNNSGKLVSHWTRTHMNTFRSKKNRLPLNSRGPNLNTAFPNWTQCYWFLWLLCLCMAEKKSLYDKLIDSSKEYSRICGTVCSLAFLSPCLICWLVQLLWIKAAVDQRFPLAELSDTVLPVLSPCDPETLDSELCCFTSCLYVDSNNYIWETMAQKEEASKKALDYLPIFLTQRKILIKIQLI